MTTTIRPDDTLEKFVAVLFESQEFSPESDSKSASCRTLVRRLTDFLQRVAVVADLNDQTYAALIPHLLKSFSIPSANRGRVQFEWLWKKAADRGLISHLQRPTKQRNIQQGDYRTLHDVVDEYFVSHDLATASRAAYRSAVSVYCTWYAGCNGGSICPVDQFTVDSANEFLQCKQRQGKSAYYRRFLRSHLRALLNHLGHTGKMRSVKTPVLTPDVWGPDEVARLVDAVDRTIGSRMSAKVAKGACRYWRTLILAAWYTGLNFCDLARIERSHVLKDGTLVIERSKTQKRVVTWLPPELTREVHRNFPGIPVWKYRSSKEFFRKTFRAIVAEAGLVGSFKKLRKSSGTAIEILNPGRGQEHLGNTRPVFERHYLSIAAMPLKPMHAPIIQRTVEGGATA